MLTPRDVYKSQRWQLLRRSKLDVSPLCEGCEQLGRVTPATTVDHQHALGQGGDPFPQLSGLTSYCHPCHAYKTNSEYSARSDATGRLLPGCTVGGWPACPNDAWNSDTTDKGKGGRAGHLPLLTQRKGGANHGAFTSPGPAAPSCTDLQKKSKIPVA